MYSVIVYSDEIAGHLTNALISVCDSSCSISILFNQRHLIEYKVQMSFFIDIVLLFSSDILSMDQIRFNVGKVNDVLPNSLRTWFEFQMHSIFWEEIECCLL